MAGETILIVDDDEDICEVISLYLKKEGFSVLIANNGNDAVSYALSSACDLIILDIMLPGLDGLEVCQEIRKKLSVPILFLSCKGDPVEKSIGLTAGGDDYMSKPFEAVELIARIKAHLRRNRMLKRSETNNQLMQFKQLKIDLSNYIVEVDGQPITLSPKEFQLLKLLAQNPNCIYSSEDLFQEIWGQDSLGDHRTVMVHISNIRRKIEKDPTNPRHIQTIKGVGYKFCAQ